MNLSSYVSITAALLLGLCVVPSVSPAQESDSPYAGQFPAAPAITDDMCAAPGEASSAGQSRIESWAKQVAASTSGVCDSAKAAHVLNTQMANIIRYCLARTNDAQRRQLGQQELESVEATVREAAGTVSGSCS